MLGTGTQMCFDPPSPHIGETRLAGGIMSELALTGGEESSRRLRRKTVFILIALSIVVASLVGVSAQPAQAAVGNVTVIYGDWNCALGGSVKSVIGHITIPGYSTNGWIGGRQFTLQAQLGVRNQIVSTLKCQRSWRPWDYYYQNSSQYRYFWHNGHTMWI